MISYNPSYVKDSLMIVIPFLSINLYAIVAGLGLYSIFGWLWYSPRMFGRLWLKAHNIKQDKAKMHAGHFIGSLFVGLAIMLTQSHLFGCLGVMTCMASIQTSILLWLGFIVSTHFCSVIFQGKSLEAFLIDIGFWLGSFILLGCSVATL